jgi:hypothetical protein
MDIIYIDKCRYEIQEQEVSVWYTGIYRPVSSSVRSWGNSVVVVVI